MRSRLLPLLGLLAVAVVSAPAALLAAQRSPTARTVSCDEAILHTAFPHRTAGARTLFNAVSIPPAYLSGVVATHEPAWPYWRKAGIVVKAGSTASVTVPKSWRTRVTIRWGDDPHTFDVLRFASCRPAPGVGYAYAGGFFARSRSVCVPLVVRSGSRSATVRFGLGRRCVK